MLARSERARINGIPRPRVRSPEFGSVIRHTPQSEIVTVNIASAESWRACMSMVPRRRPTGRRTPLRWPTLR